MYNSKDTVQDVLEDGQFLKLSKLQKHYYLLGRNKLIYSLVPSKFVFLNYLKS